ncbi:hypothetical protein TSOC_010965 [Tetrabaena socialis]|uniref:phytol kinase n=1 Tax=Tetrabaena socialis TaxID=47790 RepID=A0A2J7ZRX5_9CHLO|nr:hypothetical protein TSOC_010965 [Tetrabaena socialis]|eukprot:PNH03013.1 hypothetical protein TSOC_010965 [Tetrabaena socialis]
MALRDAVRDVARRLPAAAARLSGVPGSGGPLSAAEAEDVAAMLATLEASLNDDDQATNSTAERLILEDGLRVPMLRLVAFAARSAQHDDSPAYRDVAERTLCVCEALLAERAAPTHRLSMALLAFGRTLLRMDTLQCCSHTLSSAAAQFAALAAAGNAKAGAAVPLEGLLTHHVMWTDTVVSSLTRLAARTEGAAEPGRTGRQLKQWRQLQQQFAGELAAALRDSHVLEHTARWALHVQLAESAGWLPQGAACVPLSFVITHFVYAGRVTAALNAHGGAHEPEARSGPFVRHAVLSLGLAALCAADGGTSYGLPPELLLRLPIVGINYAPIVRGAPGKQRLDKCVFLPFMQVLGGSVDAAAAGPPRERRVAAALLHRLGRLAVTSARAWAEVGVAEARRPKLVMAEADVLPAAVRVLMLLPRLSGDEKAASTDDTAALAEAEAAWWRLAVDVATHGLWWAALGDLEKLARLLDFSWRTQRPLPPAAPRAVAAALAGGLLPLWEQLLRCAGRQADRAEADLLSHMLASPANHATFWDLLAYSDVRQAAALVATWGKLLRTLVVPQLLCSMSMGGAMDDDGGHMELAGALMDCAVKLLTSSFDRLAEAGLPHPDGVEASAPQLQLALLVSYAVCDWLPPLARLAHEGMQLTALGGPASARHVSGSGFTVLAWVPTLARLCQTQSAAGAGWRQLLLQEVGTVPLLGATCQSALGLTAASGGAPGPWILLLGSCCWLAVTCPGEVRQAVLDAAAEVAAAVGSSSGRGGGGGVGVDGWSPQLFRAIEAELRGCPGDEAAAMVAAAAALARQAELWVAGGGEDGAELGWAVAALGDQTYQDVTTRALVLGEAGAAWVAMALPDAVRDVARRLPAAAARLSGVPGSGGPLSAEEAENVVAMLATLEAELNAGDQATNSTADALLSDDALRVPMLRLMVFAVRGAERRDPPAYRDAAGLAMRVCGGLLTERAAPPQRRAVALLAFGRTLLCMDLLQCCSQAFSSAAAQFAAPAAAGGAEAVVDGTVVLLDRRHVLVDLSTLILGLLRLATRTDVAAEPGRTERQLKQYRQLQQQYAGELAAALRDSHVLEHIARCALHLQLAESAGRLPQGASGVPLSFLIMQYASAEWLAAALDVQGGALEPALGEALSGPCVRHAVLSMGVAALCAADGGASYGLPPELLLRLPLLGLNFVPIVRGAPGKQRLVRCVLISVMQVLGGSIDAAAAGPPHDWRLAVALLHRIGRFAVASARAWAEEGAAEAAAGLPQLLLEEAGTIHVARLALVQLAPLMEDHAADDAAALAEAGAAWWRLAVDVATHCVRWAAPRDLEQLARLLGTTLRSCTSPGLLPPAAPRAVAAALAGGLLPLWEQLLRCAGRQPECAEGALLSHMLASLDTPPPFWDLLAYGDVRQGAALVATWGKLLRTLAVPQLLWSMSIGSAVDDGSGCTALAGALVDFAMDLLASAFNTLEVAGLPHPDGMEASAAQLQLALLVSYALRDWLPPLARLAREGMQLTAFIGPASARYVSASGFTVLVWVPTLARLCQTQSAVGAGWRQVLLQEIGAVPLLGATCQNELSMVPGYGRDSRTLYSLLTKCCWMAAACPGEVRQAVLDGAAEAAAAAGSSSGRGVGGGGGLGGRRREGRGTSGRGGRAGPSRAAAPAPPGWSPQLFRAMEADLRWCPGDEAAPMVAAASALARQAELWVAGGGEDGGPLSAAEAEDVAAMLATLEAELNVGDQATNSTADALLSDDALRVPMLRLMAFAVRGAERRDPPAYRDAADRCMRVCGALLTERAAPPQRRAVALLAFGRTLLRMDLLQCCSQAFSSAAAQFAAPAAAGGAKAVVDGTVVLLDRRHVLVDLSTLILGLLRLATRTDVAAEPGRTERQLKQWRQLQQQYAGELAAALRDSHVLEHIARCALHLQLAESAGRLPQGASGVPLSFLIMQYASAEWLAAALDVQGGALEPALDEALSGPCVRHAVLSMGVAALCAADGGASYGLPPELLLRLPLLGLNFVPIVRGAPGKQRLARCVLISVMQVLGGSIDAAAAGPPHDWRLAAALLHRIGRFAVASARAWAEEGAAEAAAGLPQLLLEEPGTIHVARLALVQLAPLMEDHAADDAAALAEAGAAWWQLAVDVATHCVRWAAPRDLEQLARLLDFTWRTQRLLPPAAPRAVAAALAGGLLPLWEQLLRCAGRQPECAEGALLSHMLASLDNPPPFWDLLAYGDVRQGAALVATWGKLLRTLAVPQLLWSMSIGCAVDDGSGCTVLAGALVDFAVDMLTPAFNTLEVAGLSHPDGVEASAPQLQLALLVSYAVCEWLPPLARLALEGMQLTAFIGPASARYVSASGFTVLAWVPTLARLCQTQSAAGAGWRQLLLQEIGVMSLLGATCQNELSMVPGYGRDSRTLYSLLTKCCWMAAACPGLLPPAAPRAVAAALAGGLLPLWEQLLRCAGRQPECAEGALLSHMLASLDNPPPFWDLLAYGDVRQGAALVATWGKLLRTLAVPQLLWSMSIGCAVDDGSGCTVLAGALVDFAVDMLTPAFNTLEVAGLSHPDGVEASAPQLQLALLVSYAVCEWLPPLARLALEGMQLTAFIGPASARYVSASGFTVLAWVPTLARLCQTQSAAGAGWRQLLLQEIGVMSLLGATCQNELSMVPGYGRDSCTLCSLLNKCCWMAAACPGEVRQAVLDGAAEAAAAAGSSSGRGGGGGGGLGGRRREGRGTSGRGGRAGPSRAAAPAPPGWSPQLFRAMEAELRWCPGDEAAPMVAAAAALVRQAELWVAGGSEDGAELGWAAEVLGDSIIPDAVARAMLPSAPADARALLRTCTNPACDNLAGDSEAALPLRACGRCGAAWYCRRECLASHWRSGHKEACVARGEAAAGAAAPGQSEA